MDDRIDKLVLTTAQLLAANAELLAAVREQAVHNAMLVQSVALLLGEELGAPVPEDGQEGEAGRTDLDGNPY